MSKPANRILLIDDELQIRRFVAVGLELYGYSVSEAEKGVTGLKAAAHTRPDLVILDLALPDMSGFEVLKTIRSWSNVPVIVLSVEADEEQKVLLLRGGADDYVTKPFAIGELAARCEAALRRFHKSVDKDPLVRTGPLTIDLVTRAVTLHGQHVALTRKEYHLLYLLASHLGLVITHNQLIKDLWGNSSPDNIQYLRTLVRQLRQKLEANPGQPRLLISESGVGYRLAGNAASSRSSW
jgi:two-component system, OmpR family, KDP operon response regulator KdpE